MNWTVHPLQRSLGPHAADWDALCRRHFGGHGFVSRDFVETLLQHFGRGDEVLCTRREGSELRAMCILRPGRLGLWQSFLPSQAQVGPSLFGQVGDLAGLLPALPGYAQRVDLLCVDPLLSLATPALHGVGESVSHALTMAIDLGLGYERWWQARGKKLRDNLKRYERRAVDEGLSPRLVHLDRPEDMAAAVERYARLEDAGWKGAQGTAVNEATGQLAFYGELLARFAAKGEAHVYELWFGEELAASRLMLACNGIVLALKTSYDERFRRHAPGRLLMLQMIRDAFERWPGWSLEFYTNATLDQLAWASSQRHIVHLSLYRNTAVRVLHEARRGWLYRLRHRRAGDGPRATDSYASPQACPTEVRALLSKGGADRIGQGAEWYEHFVASVCRQREVQFLALRDGDEVRAAVPLMASADDPTQLEALGNYYTTLYAPALEPGLEPTALAPLLRVLKQRPAGLGTLRFAPMDPCGPGYATLRASLSAAGFATFEFFCHGNWYLPVRHGWDDYLASRDGRLRSTIRRMEKRLQAAGARIEVISAPADAERGIAAFEQVYAHSWKRPEPYPDFVPGLIRLCAANGWLRLGLVTLGGTPVAAQLWIVANGRAEIYKLAHDEAYKGFAPGTVLTAHLMRHVIEADRVREVDYLIGDEAYKSQWMSHRRERWGLVAYNLRSASGLAGWLKELAARSTWPLRRLWRQPAPTPAAAGHEADRPGAQTSPAPHPTTEEAP